jgi:4-amino-4-deoxy-L-arabinose transferase-like glycosyltransferase
LDTHSKPAHLALILGATLTLAFSIRLGVRLAFGEDGFWSGSYLTYYRLAQNIVSGNGFCFQVGFGFGNTCAWLPPIYPLFLTLSVLLGKSYLLIVVPQALLGAGTALCAFMIGRHVFNASVGILACAIAAFYPYYVMHDTALQETGMVTFCTALAIWLLLRASKLNRNRDWFLAGVALGAIPLIRASVAPAVAVGIIWCAIWGAPGNYLERLRKSFVVLVAVASVTGPWLVRTYHVTGAPVFSSQTGWALWMGNNAQTFSHYPAESIDLSRNEAWLKLLETNRTDLQQLPNDEIARSNSFAHRALLYMRENPLLALQGMFHKLDAAFSWRLNPFRGPIAQAAYSIAYVPIAILGIVGMFLARGRREVILIAMLFIAFMCVTAVFWAHTAHRSYLDVYLIVFAASAVERLWSSHVLSAYLSRIPFAGCLLKTKVDRDRDLATEQQTKLHSLSKPIEDVDANPTGLAGCSCQPQR